MFKGKKDIIISYYVALKEICKESPISIIYDEDKKQATVFLEKAPKPLIVTDVGVSDHLSKKYINHDIQIRPIINLLDEINDVEIVLTKVKRRKVGSGILWQKLQA